VRPLRISISGEEQEAHTEETQILRVVHLQKLLQKVYFPGALFLIGSRIGLPFLAHKAVKAMASRENEEAAE
jgi:hypothetical protein